MRYGDGLFETLRIHNGEILFQQDHLDRMLRGMKALKMSIPPDFTEFFFHKQVLELALKEKIEGNARIRIGIYRSGEGQYEPVENTPEYYIEITPMEKAFEWNEESCRLIVFEEVRKNFSPVSFFKSTNALPCILAAIFRAENNAGDCLLLNNEGNIADAISSNLFWIRHGKVYAPPVTDGGVDGIMRRQMIRILLKNNFDFAEKSCTPSNLKLADEVFLTNVGWGIKPVTNFETARYSSYITREIFSLLQNELT